MTIVSDPSANAYEKIQRAAEVLRSSPQNKEVFIIIYSGGKFKTIDDIKSKVSKFNTNTYKAAKRLYGEDIIDKKVEKRVVYYGKKTFYTTNRDKILKLSENSKRLKTYPTKRNVKVLGSIPSATAFSFFTKPQVKQIYIDDIDSFKKVHGVKVNTKCNIKKISERIINKGFCNILNQDDKKDWGGERNDIFSNRIVFGGKRKSSAFAIKGKATQGILTPNKMGKNGDQIQRLFEGTSELHFIVYHSQIDERVNDLMQSIAISKAVRENKKIYYCTVDGDDLSRLISAYPKEFNINN